METIPSAAIAPARIALKGVPRVAFWDPARQEKRCPEDITFPSCVRAIMEYLGEGMGCQHCSSHDPAWGLNCAYSYVMGTSGIAFFASWRNGWHEDNGDVRYMSDDPAAPFRRALDSVGYDGQIITEQDRAQFRPRIVQSIQEGKPALALGVVGPPECCIITGYDQGGETLMGWSFFQGMPEFAHGVEFEPTGEFRKKDWEPNTQAVIIIGDKRGHPKMEEVYRSALQWGLQVMRTPQVVTYGAPRHNGLAAFDAWAEHLLRDEDFASNDQGALRQRFRVHDFAVGMIAEARWYGSVFLAQAAQCLWRAANDLYQAAACFAAEHALMWKAWDAVGGIGYSEQKVHNLALPRVRRDIVPIIRQAHAKDEEAADHIERALAQLE